MAWRELDDREALRASREGRGGFDLFYRRHREAILAFHRRRVRDPEVAADLTAETFAAALAGIHDRDRALPEQPVAWLFTIAHRKLIDSYRRGAVESEARRQLALDPLVLYDDDLARVDEITATTDVAMELARQLPPEQFEALKARVLDERSYADIAGELACSEVVVRMRLSRALRALRTAIGRKP